MLIALVQGRITLASKRNRCVDQLFFPLSFSVQTLPITKWIRMAFVIRLPSPMDKRKSYSAVTVSRFFKAEADDWDIFGKLNRVDILSKK